MIYQSLYARANRKGPVTAGLIGVGSYGTAVLTQSVRIPTLRIPVIADRSMDAAQLACQRAGIPEERIARCSSRPDALRALEAGKYVLIDDPSLMMDLPLDVIVESTGVAENGARHALEAIRHGKHVAMITKETDSVVGPILKYLADRAGVVYTPVDGDQHGLLIGFVQWIRSIGLEVVCAGKSRDAEFVFDRDAGWVCDVSDGNIVREDRRMFFPKEDWSAFDYLPEGKARECTQRRRKLLASQQAAAPYDICESVIAANALGLSPDVPATHNPILRTQEIPEALCLESEGGILTRGGILDMVTCLRGHREAALGGGVFAVVSCENEWSRRTVITKGLHANRQGTTAVLYRPYHLCGVETPTSLICAGLLGVGTGSDDYQPRFDMVYRSKVDLKKGEPLNDRHGRAMSAEIAPMIPLTGAGLLPACLGFGQELTRDVPAGTLIGQEMVKLPWGSTLMNLRRQQDEHFTAG